MVMPEPSSSSIDSTGYRRVSQSSDARLAVAEGRVDGDAREEGIHGRSVLAANQLGTPLRETSTSSSPVET